MVEPAIIPEKLRAFVERALHFASSQLALHDVFYPYAAVCDRGEFRCVMTDHHPNATQPSEMIEMLQWRLIDIAQERPVQTALVYAATLANDDKSMQNAVAIELTDEIDNSYFYVFAYRKSDGQILFSRPLTENSN